MMNGQKNIILGSALNPAEADMPARGLAHRLGSKVLPQVVEWRVEAIFVWYANDEGAGSKTKSRIECEPQSILMSQF